MSVGEGAVRLCIVSQIFLPKLQLKETLPTHAAQLVPLQTDSNRNMLFCLVDIASDVEDD